MTRSAAATLVREIEREPEVQAALQQAEDERWDEEQFEANPILHAARVRLETQAREEVGRPRRTRTEPGSGTQEPLVISGAMIGGVVRGEGVHRHRNTRVEVEGTQIRVTDLGPERRGANRQEG